MSSTKTQFIKKRLARAYKKNRGIPQWKYQLEGFTQKYNTKKRNWRTKKLNIR